VKAATNERLLIFESHGDSNRCTPFRGIPDQHITRFPCSARVWPSTIRILHGLRIATLRELSTELDRVTAPEKRALDTIHSTPAVRSAGPYPFSLSFLSWANQWSSGESQTSVNSKLLVLLGPYHRHAIGTFNTCSWGQTYRSLTDTGGGYNLEGADLPHTTHQPSQLAVSTFHLRAPHDLKLSIQQLPTELKWSKP
jgi:hypothetical protein